MTVFKWSTTASDNNDADGSINWSEGQAPSTVNDSARAMMAALKKLYNELSGNIETGGSSTAYTVGSAQGYDTAYRDGDWVTVRIHTLNGAAATLNVNSLGAKAIRISNGTALPTGALAADSIQSFTYDLEDDCFYLHGSQIEVPAFPTATSMIFRQTAAPTGWTKILTHNNKALRLVNGTAGTGGTEVFTDAFASRTPSGTVGGTTLTIAQIPSHSHNLTFGDNNNDGVAPPFAGSNGNVFGTASVQSAGGGGSHDHSLSMNDMNFAVAYVDVIVADKD